jgi:DNA-entry nuclease
MSTKKKSTKLASGIGAAVIALAGLLFAGNDDLRTTVTDHLGFGSQAAADPAVNQDGDYFTVVGAAHRDYDAPVGEVAYCDLDGLSRATCAYGELTSTQRAAAKDRGRQDISVNPAGWGHNAKVEIPALDGVDGSTDYHGYMYNRSHMVGDSLGGDPTLNNLVTGTRGQNVGSAGNKGGMAHTEVIARDYLDTRDGDACPLYYAATPNYEGSELLPRTVTVDIQSCDKSIDERVVVDNTANGHTIDYANGSFK